MSGKSEDMWDLSQVTMQSKPLSVAASPMSLSYSRGPIPPSPAKVLMASNVWACVSPTRTHFAATLSKAAMASEAGQRKGELFDLLVKIK